MSFLSERVLKAIREPMERALSLLSDRASPSEDESVVSGMIYHSEILPVDINYFWAPPGEVIVETVCTIQ